VSGASHEEIAQKHGVSPATVRDWATSASRVLRLAVEADPEDIRARLLTTLEKVVASAMGRTSPKSTGDLYSNPDLKAAVSAIAEQAKLLGLVVTKTQEIPLSEDQARAKYRELTGQDWSGK
jgi:transposase-like protein